MDMVLIIMEMEINMQVNGKMVKEVAKVLYMMLTEINSMKDNG